MDNSRPSRRTFLGQSLVFLGGYGAALASCEPQPPLAQWPEDDMQGPETPREDLTQPMILWGSVIAQPNVDSPVPNEQLANPFGLPMEILAMRFRLLPQLRPDTSDSFARVTGGAVKVKIDLGPAAIASDIPLGLFGDMRDTYEAGSAQFGAPVYTGSELSFPTAYDWRLRYPLFVPAGKVAAAVFTPIGINPIPVRVDVAYICRTWDPTRKTPTKIKVPWAASFESKSFEYSTGQGADRSVSSQLDVVNPFACPLELSRLSGRCTKMNLTAVGATQANFVQEDLAEYRQHLSTMRMRSSRGFDLIRTPVPFDGVFPVNWRSWDILDGWSMAPREYYRVQVDVSAIAGTITAANVATSQFTVGVVGYRDVEVASIEDSEGGCAL
jgi:hypothetical protein